MRVMKRSLITTLLLSAAIPGALAAFNVTYTVKRPFPQKQGATGAEINGDLRGIDVNTNPGSLYYGWVYIADKSGLSATSPGRILIYKPVPESHRHGAAAYEDTGLRIIVNTTTSQFSSLQAPMGVSVGPDDSVWITDFSERQIEVAPPVPTEGTSVTSAPVINLPDFDTQALAELPAPGVETWTVGHPRNVHVAGTPDAITVIVCNNTGDTSSATGATATDQTIQKFTVTNADTTPVVTYNWTRPITAMEGTSPLQGSTGYDATTDHLGNVYVPLRADAGQITVLKYSPDGVLQTAPQFLAPTGSGPTGATHPGGNQPGIAFVKDPTVAGGGYLYWTARYDNGNQPTYRYDLEGNLLDGLDGYFGSTAGITGNVLGYTEADDSGNLYQRLGNTTGNANLIKIFKSPRYIEVGGAVKSSPTVIDGIAYFGGQDGKVYGINTTTGEAAPNYPVDINAATGDTGVPILSRPNLHYLDGLFFLYFTTANGRVVRLPLSGDTSTAAGFWASSPLVTSTTVSVTPAPEYDGVYVAMGEASGAKVFRLDPRTGAVLDGLPLVGAVEVLSSPSLFDGTLYVGTDAGIFRILSAGGTIVPVTKAGGDTVGSPFVNMRAPAGPTMYAADRAGTVYARNAFNFNPVAEFGGGEVTLSDGASATPPAVAAGPFVYNGRVYVGAEDNKVYALAEADGSGAGPGGSMVFFDAGPGTTSGIGIPQGVSVAPALDGSLAVVFGSRNGLFYQVREQDPAAYRVTMGVPVATDTVYLPTIGSSFDTAPGVDRSTPSVFIGNDDGRVYGIPAF